jgi:hypothetical protein
VAIAAAPALVNDLHAVKATRKPGRRKLAAGKAPVFTI